VATVVILESVDDPRVAEYALSDPELLRDRGLFVAEGRLVVRRVLEDPRCRVRSLLLNQAARRALHAELSALRSDAPIYECATDAFRAITGFNLHRGCLALVERPQPLALSAAIDEARLVLILEQITNPDNVGGIFRSAAAFGADAVLLTAGSSDPLYRKAIRTSMAATLRVPFAQLESWPQQLDELRKRRFVVVALTPRLPAIPLEQFALDGPGRVALLVGSEGAGLSAVAEGAADLRVRIPITTAVDSLNTAVAAAIALHAIARRTLASG
jgi:tRNA G18 (ribose-2'-O)-methylase SpoU